ncbi:hypothetical protein DL96DRAFT_1717592 [Flagelloscypha sp. PMI_526]|nr:hypothetical protein DL96DRAFT_1717592 [Flagelloscypha sp. PMI_526]
MACEVALHSYLDRILACNLSSILKFLLRNELQDLPNLPLHSPISCSHASCQYKVAFRLAGPSSGTPQSLILVVLHYHGAYSGCLPSKEACVRKPWELSLQMHQSLVLLLAIFLYVCSGGRVEEPDGGDETSRLFGGAAYRRISLPPPLNPAGDETATIRSKHLDLGISIHIGASCFEHSCKSWIYSTKRRSADLIASRGGLSTFEEIVQACETVFNMDQKFGFALTGFAMLARGNCYTNQLSIGGPSPLVPPLPNKLDGNVTKGITTHGRLEGDVSLTREDFYLGDNVNFQKSLFDKLLETVREYGDDDPITGPNSLVSVEAMGEFKYRRFLDSQQRNNKLEFHAVSPLRTCIVIVPSQLRKTGTTGKLSTLTLTSFFQNQTFPHNWHRRPTSASFSSDIRPLSLSILSVHPTVRPGVNSPNGTYILDPGNPTEPCTVYNALGRDNVPSVVLGSGDEDLERNAKTLVGAMNLAFDGCPLQIPSGPPGV